MQTRIAEWVRSRLGDDAMSPQERGTRLLEEALELAQAVGVTSETALRLHGHVFSKEQGQIKQEIGGVMVTLLALAEGTGNDAYGCGLMELERIESLPPEKFKKRQDLNASLGIGAPVRPS